MRRVIKSIAVIAALLVIGTGIYLSDYYTADEHAMEAAEKQKGYVTEMTDKYIAFLPEDTVGGLIFYPGGKVEYEAYAPLMGKLAENGITCVLVRMPGNLAVFDKNAADGIKAHYSDVYRWCIGGHSLGGVMAASYLADHPKEYFGLVLLASYTTEDLSEEGHKVLSIYGSKDGVLNMEKYEECRKNLPSDFKEVVIEGGCHAYFGDYGFQKNDGIPSITREEQIAATAKEVCAIYQK